MKRLSIFYTLLIFLICFLNYKLEAQTTIKKNGNNWELHINNKPFDIKGATFGFTEDVENYDSYFKDLVFLGVNSIRIWNTDENTGKLLDSAHKYGINVMVGIWMRHGRPGMEDDDSFNYLEDFKGMDDMHNNAIKAVKEYKNHPAVLTWGIGNEVYLNMATDAEKEAYSKFLEKVCSDIKTIDANHPITSVEAWTFGLDWWEKYVPSIDVYGINTYGAGANFVNEELNKRNIDKPYIITEFGVTGEWDVPADNNGIKIEPSDSQKYDAIVSGYPNWISNKPSCLGVYVFHYGNGSDFGSSWLLTHHRNMYRPQYWAVREAYTNNKPINNVPIINEFNFTNDRLRSGAWVPISLKVNDPENEKLHVSFYYNQRTGSRIRKSQINKLNYRGDILNGFEIQMPDEDGAIKIYVNVNDEYKNVAISSKSVFLKNDIPKANKYLVAKTTLPFYVYQDSDNMSYVPTGYMGNYGDIEVETNYRDNVQSGSSCIRIGYKAYENWYGIGFVDPPNDWGETIGGYDISGAETFSFWARANTKSLIATIGFGLIDKDKPYPDTSKKSIEVKLTTKWKKYTIKTKNLDLSCIRSGLVIFSQSYGNPQDIYLDNIVFE
jgi:hypothetical protein